MVTAYHFVPANTPERRKLAFDQMQADGLDRVVLWNKAEPSIFDWLQCVNPSQAVCALGYSDDTLAGALWINPVMGLCGCVHFCVFKAGRSDWENLGRQAIAWIFDQYPLAALTAIYPANYRHVTTAAKAWGFDLASQRLPLACHMPTINNPRRCRDALVAVLRRENFKR